MWKCRCFVVKEETNCVLNFLISAAAQSYFDSFVCTFCVCYFMVVWFYYGRKIRIYAGFQESPMPVVKCKKKNNKKTGKIWSPLVFCDKYTPWNKCRKVANMPNVVILK